MFAGNFAPRGWAFCQGQILEISKNNALFSILGTTYGGDGRASFALPDLRGRTPVGTGNGSGLTTRELGNREGLESQVLTTNQMPNHTHQTTNTTADQHILLSKNVGVNEIPQTGDIPAVGNIPANLGVQNVKSYVPAGQGNTVNGQTITGNTGLSITSTGGNTPLNNMQPFLGMNYIIALQGVYPSRS